MNFVLVMFLGLLSINTWALSTFSPETEIINSKSFEFELKGELFSSEGYYDYDGTLNDFTSGSKFERLDSTFTIGYGFSKNFDLVGGILYRQNNVTAVDATSVSHEMSSAGIESYILKLKYMFSKLGRIKYGLVAGYRLKAYTNEEYNPINPYDFTVLGDDGSELSFGLNTNYSFQNGNVIEVNVLYNMPELLSNEVIYNFDGALVFESFAAILGVKGIYSLNGDEYTTSTNLKPRLDAGPSFMYNSINRSYTAPYIQLNFKLGKRMRLEMGGASKISGVSTDAGTEFFGSLVLETSGESETENIVGKFKDYSLEGQITKVSPRGGFVEIDKGIVDEVSKGMKMDIYEDDNIGGSVLLATGVVYEVQARSSILKIVKKFRGNREVVVGNTVRAAL